MITIYSPSKLLPVEADILEHAWRLSGASPNEKLPLATPNVGRLFGSASVVVLGSTACLSTIRVASNTRVIPSLSPAQLRTKPDALTALRAALRLARQIAEGNVPKRPSGAYRTAQSRREVESWLAERTGSRLYLDIETQGDIHRLHHSERELLCVGLLREAGEPVFIVPRPLLQEPWPELIELLAAHRLCAHNGKFDLGTLTLRLGAHPGALKLDFDTMLAHYALQPAGGVHSLEGLAVRYLGAEPWDLSTNKADLASVETTRLHRYNALDVQHGWQLMEFFEPLLRADEQTHTMFRNVLLRASYLLQKREPHGIGFDRDYTREELAETLEMEKERRHRKLVEMAHTVLPRTKTVDKKRSRTVKDPKTGEKVRTTWTEQVEIPYEFNPGSPQQLLRLYEALGKKLPSTDKSVFEPRAEAGDAFAQELLHWRKVTKEYGTYVMSLLDKSNDLLGSPRVFPSYKLHGTVTGRLSSENPNIQNIPRKKVLRRMFVPYAPDRLLCQVDFGQAELRVIAAESKCRWLLDIFADPDVDVFDQMLPEVFPLVDFTGIDAAERKELRAKLKGVIYGLNFGRGAAAIAHAIGSTVTEAHRIINLFFDNGPEISAWRNWVMGTVHTGEPLVTRTGRRFQHEVVTPQNVKAVKRSALSALPQGNSSDVTLLAACEAQDIIEAKEYDWHLVALVHDAITLDVPAAEVEQAADFLSQTMKATARQWFPEVPFATDAKWGTSWDQTS